MKLVYLLAALAAASVAAPVPAAQEERGAYRHQRSGLVAPAVIAGLRRAQEQDSGRDLMLSYRDGSSGTILTIYFTRPPVPNASLWYAQAQHALRINPLIRVEPEPAPVVERFSTGASGLNGIAIAFAVTGAGMRSTVLAMVPAGDRILKLRMSSARLDQRQILERVIAAVRQLQLPPFSQQPAQIAEIDPCGAPVAASAQAAAADPSPQRTADAAQFLLQSLDEIRRSELCSGSLAEAVGIYASRALRGYLLALGDAGIMVRVRPLGEAGLHVVELFTLDSAHIAGFFRAVPSPEQAVAAAAAAMEGRSLARVPLPDAELRRPPPGAPLT